MDFMQALGQSVGTLELQTTILPPLSVDLAAATQGAPPSTGPSATAQLFGWLVRPTVVQGGRVIPLTQYGPPPANVAPLLGLMALAQVGLSVYGAYKVVQWLRSR